MSHALDAKTKNALNRKPLWFPCSNFQVILLSMMSMIRGASYNRIDWNGLQNLEFFNDFIRNDPS